MTLLLSEQLHIISDSVNNGSDLRVASLVDVVDKEFEFARGTTGRVLEVRHDSEGYEVDVDIVPHKYEIPSITYTEEGPFKISDLHIVHAKTREAERHPELRLQGYNPL